MEGITENVFVLVPMADVTDVVLRQVVANADRPNVGFTEFTYLESYCHYGQISVRGRLLLTEDE